MSLPSNRVNASLPGSSMYSSEESSQLDDDCASENSFGSDFGDQATDEEDLATDAEVELDSPPPNYTDEETPQSIFIVPNMDLKSPPPEILQYTPEPAPRANLLKGPSTGMCVVCNLVPAYNRRGVSYPTCGLTCASKMPNPEVPITSPILPEPQTPPQYTDIAPSAYQSDISHSTKQDSVKGSQSRVRASASQINLKMCVVCHVRPRAQKGRKIYPTCGFTCAAAMENSPNNVPTLGPLIPVLPSYPVSDHSPGSHQYPQQRSRASRLNGGQHNADIKGNIPALDPLLLLSYREMSLSDHSSSHSPQQPSGGHGRSSRGQHGSESHEHPRSRGSTGTQIVTTGYRRPRQVYPPCVVCLVKPCRDDRYVTCGMKCALRLCTRGSSNPLLCDYCHRRPKAAGHNQCGKTCRDNANIACLLCRSRPRFGRYHLCGKTCKKIATKQTPLILEARHGHTTYHQVEKRFKRAWKNSGTTCPPIKQIYKIIENKSFLLPYDQYKKQIGNEVFRYHGTSRKCSLGTPGNTRLCSSSACSLCSILRTSFKVNLASPSGAFGAGVYTSSASNKAYSYSRGGTGAIIVTKVVLGTVYKVQGWNEVMSCPLGHNSVVFDRQNGMLNETIVYTDDAIRPVFLIIF